MATCYNCGHELHWESDEMASELGYVPADPDEDYIVNVLSCPNCGARTECHQLSPRQERERENEK